MVPQHIDYNYDVHLTHADCRSWAAHPEAPEANSMQMLIDCTDPPCSAPSWWARATIPLSRPIHGENLGGRRTEEPTRLGALPWNYPTTNAPLRSSAAECARYPALFRSRPQHIGGETRDIPIVTSKLLPELMTSPIP